MLEDRLHDALIGGFSIAENLLLDQHDRKPFGSPISLNLKWRLIAMFKNEYTRSMCARHPSRYPCRHCPPVVSTSTQWSSCTQKRIVADWERGVAMLLVST